ncbi:MAG: mannose-6-phosphate isomerase, class I [Bacillus sp. (in: firmicutes)]
MEPLFLQPVFQERIWGGKALRDEFGYDIPSERTGECWAISAHPNGPSIVKNGPYAGKTLDQLWKEHRELFGNEDGEVFPLLTKILDANMDLSVQVHPDDEYAAVHENGELGKTECWYILDCKENAKLIFGHTAKTKEELERQIKEGEWDHLLQKVDIKPGDFFYVPSGTIHALCEGTLVLETQQSSDTTYRLYDYNRLDANGKPRELHLQQSIDVATVPHQAQMVEPIVEQKEDLTITKFVESEFFSEYKWDVNGSANLQADQYLLCSVIDGEGIMIQGNREFSLKKGDDFILPAGFGEFELNGQVEMIVSHT